MNNLMMARHRHRPDPGTAERLVAGRLDPDDTPPGYRRVAGLLAAARRTSTSCGAAEATDVAAMAAAIRELHSAPNSPRRKNRMLSHLALAKAVAVLSAITLPAGAAAAATGHLPSSLQNKVANAVEHVGVNLPGGDEADTADANGKGADISDTARNTKKTGVDKGAEISDKASGGKSQAGQDHGAPASNPAGIETPNSGGLGTAGTASDGANSTGADSANDAATAGFANADDHPAGDDHPTAGDHPTADSPSSAESHPGGRP